MFFDSPSLCRGILCIGNLDCIGFLGLGERRVFLMKGQLFCAASMRDYDRDLSLFRLSLCNGGFQPISCHADIPLADGLCALSDRFQNLSSLAFGEELQIRLRQTRRKGREHGSFAATRLLCCRKRLCMGRQYDSRVLLFWACGPCRGTLLIGWLFRFLFFRFLSECQLFFADHGRNQRRDGRLFNGGFQAAVCHADVTLTDGLCTLLDGFQNLRPLAFGKELQVRFRQPKRKGPAQIGISLGQLSFRIDRPLYFRGSTGDLFYIRLNRGMLYLGRLCHLSFPGLFFRLLSERQFLRTAYRREFCRNVGAFSLLLHNGGFQTSSCHANIPLADGLCVLPGSFQKLCSLTFG